LTESKQQFAVRSERHRGFGKRFVGQNWKLRL